jgi:hypothetical protein
MSRACAKTIGLRIRTSRHDGESARCSASNRPDQPNVSCPFTPPSKTLSTFNAISPPAARFASSETKRSGRGELRRPHELKVGRDNFPRPIQVHVTASSTLLAAEVVGRRCRAAEIDGPYCDVIIRRWREMTGRDAVLESTGETFAEVEAQRGSQDADGPHRTAAQDLDRDLNNQEQEDHNERE